MRDRLGESAACAAGMGSNPVARPRFAPSDLGIRLSHRAVNPVPLPISGAPQPRSALLGPLRRLSGILGERVFGPNPPN